MLLIRTIIYNIFFSITFYIIHVESNRSYTFEHVLVQPIYKKLDGNKLFLIDYNFNGFELHPWSYPDIFDRNTLIYSTDLLPVHILKLLKTSNCTYFLATIGDGHWDDRFSHLPVNTVTSGSTLIANLPKNVLQESWLRLTHGLWGLTGVSYNMLSKPALLRVTSLSDLEKTTLEGLRWCADHVDELDDDVDLELVEGYLYNYQRRERAIAFGMLPEENLCTDNFYMLEKLLPCRYHKGIAKIFANLRDLNAAEYKGARLFASLQSGRLTFSMNIQYTTSSTELAEYIKCYGMDQSDVYARSAHKDKIIKGFDMLDGSYLYNIDIANLKTLQERLEPVETGGIKLLFEETEAFGFNRRTFSKLSITVKNNTKTKMKIKSITTIPRWITPLGQSLIISNGITQCIAVECFKLPEMVIEWNKQLIEDDIKKIELSTSIQPDTSLTISFTIAKTILSHYAMQYDELKGQLFPGTLLLYTESDFHAGTSIDALLQSDFRGTRILFSNALIMKTFLPDHTMAYNALSMATILVGILIASIRSVQE